MNLDKMITDICKYVVLDLQYLVNVRSLKTEIWRHISHIVQSAPTRATGKNVIGILRQINSFSLVPKSIIRLRDKQFNRESFSIS